MSGIHLVPLAYPGMERQPLEIVERKGIGHPDTICDGIMEAVSQALSREYLDRFGRVLHHNTDKGLLVAGEADTKPGGGTIRNPMRLVIGDRATAEYKGESIDVKQLSEQAVHQWIAEHLRFVRPREHLLLQNELKPGSSQLMDIFERETIGANDTSAAVGYAPMSETERMVLWTEEYLNSSEFKQEFPEAGEDIKVMGVRRGSELSLTIAVAMVDRFIKSKRAYFESKKEMEKALRLHLELRMQEIDSLQIAINTLDDRDRDEGSMYLTVLGTSAESADCGQVGRGNRVNGVIPLNRPTGTEAAAGKNPVSHVGKIYSVLSHRIADLIHANVGGVEEVYVWLCSQIGRSIADPQTVSAQVNLTPGASMGDVHKPIEEIMTRELAGMQKFTAALAMGEYTLY